MVKFNVSILNRLKIMELFVNARYIHRYVILSIVIRNGKIVWKHGPNRPFFLYNSSSENYQNPVQASQHQIQTKSCGEPHNSLNLRMSGESCLIFNWHSSRTASGISFFRVPTKNDEYSINQRNNIVAVITCVVIPDTMMKAI